MNFILNENGQSMVEYALILGLIAVVAVVVLVAMGPKIRSMYEKSDNLVNNSH